MKGATAIMVTFGDQSSCISLVFVSISQTDVYHARVEYKTLYVNVGN